MSFSAVVAQVLEKNNAIGEKLSADYLSMVCTSAVRESLANVFGEKSNSFSRSFEKSFGSTLRTLRLINESSQKNTYSLNCLNSDTSASDSTISKNVGETSCSMENSHSQREFSSFSIQVRVIEEEEGGVRAADYLSQELDSCGQIGQLIPATRPLTSVSSQLEKSVFERTRLNNLKEVKMALTMRKLQLKEAQLAERTRLNNLEEVKTGLTIRELQLKEAQLAISSVSNDLERSKLAVGESKFETRHTELLKKGSESRWIPNPMASFNSGRDHLKCLVQVASRMMFGLLMILAISYLLLQQSGGGSLQAMPVTLMLAVMCLLHFISIVCTPTLFGMLYGPVTGTKSSKVAPFLPYWLRRFLYYALLLAFMPLCCGLLLFAGLGEWKKQFGLFAGGLLSTTAGGD